MADQLCVSKNGYADYAFFIGEKLVALMDAKKVSEDVASTIDVQVKDYAKHIKEEHKRYTIGLWDEYQVPFLFASNGRAFFGTTSNQIWHMVFGCTKICESVISNT